MDENKDLVMISKYDYETLIRAEYQRDMLVRTLLKTARLNYSHDALDYSDAAISLLLGAISQVDVDNTIEKLQREYQKKLDEAKAKKEAE